MIEWWQTFQDAKWVGVPPWELVEQSDPWRNWIRACRQEEQAAEAHRRRQQNAKLGH